MAHLIDKDAVIAEIKKIIPSEPFPKTSETLHGAEVYGKRAMGFKILDLIDTLEVKEVDLDEFTEKINTFQARYKHPEITSIKGAMAFMARMFYQYPNVAREWYESLPKATMD